jgi:hypothetical protein
VPSSIDLQLNAIFKSYEDARFAHIKEHPIQERERVADGLAASCAMLQELQAIEALRAISSNEDTLKYLADADHLQRFLLVERKLLEFTKLDPHVVDFLMKAMERVLRDARAPGREWKHDLEILAVRICDEARRAAHSIRPHSLLKRGLVAGGGALVALLNLAPPAAIALPPAVTTVSTTVGVWMISEAAKDQLKRFFES